jgi:hypothetical protein
VGKNLISPDLSKSLLRWFSVQNILSYYFIILSNPEVNMELNKETPATIRSRLDVLRKGIISEENSVNYYQTLIEKTPEDTESNIGMRRMYYD